MIKILGDIVGISKYKNNFAKFYVRNWRTCKNAVLWTHVISDLNGEEIVGKFY